MRLFFSAMTFCKDTEGGCRQHTFLFGFVCFLYVFSVMDFYTKILSACLCIRYFTTYELLFEHSILSAKYVPKAYMFLRMKQFKNLFYVQSL